MAEDITTAIPGTSNDRFHDLWAMARASHPTIALSRESFETVIVDLETQRRFVSWESLVSNAADLYLAVACSAGIPSAMSAFEQGVLSQVPRMIAMIDRRPDFADEVRQRLRERLLGPPRPRLRDYSAAGSLRAWIRIAARRLAIDLKRARGEADELAAESVSEVVGAGRAAEWEILRGRYHAPLEESTRAAVAALSPRERMVLRLYLLRGENIERIGAIYGVHRATVARWITAAQQRVLEAVRGKLCVQLGISESECDSLARDLRSCLSLSLDRIL